MSNYPVAQTAGGVPAPRGLVFEPTEILANRVIDSEAETKALRRKVTGRTLLALILFFMLLTAAAAVAFVWWSSQQQVKLSEQRVQAIEATLLEKDEELLVLSGQRDTLRDFANSLEEYGVAQRASDDLDFEQQDFLQLTRWYLENDITVPEPIMNRWYPGGEANPVLQAIKAAIIAEVELPPLDSLRIAVGSDGWRERGVESLISDKTALAAASTELRNRTARLAAAADRPPPPPPPPRKVTPY